MSRAALLPSYWSGSTIGNVPIGQGIGVTPIQMATAYAAIANGGVMRTPHLVERIGDKRVSAHKGHRVISKTVSAQMMAMLRDVVSAEGGTGAAAKVPGYTVAGKTGTAAKPVPGATRPRATSPRSSASCLRRTRASSSSSRSTSREARSGAASSRRLHSPRSPVPASSSSRSPLMRRKLPSASWSGSEATLQGSWRDRNPLGGFRSCAAR